MDKRYQIFVSSTYSDLKEERESVINELTRVGYIAVGMEQFPATDEEQLEYIQKIIDESDYYVVIIRGKYGSLANDGISFTEKECDYALETKKPVLAFLVKNPGNLRVDETDYDPEKAQKLIAFKKKLEEKRIVKYWEDGSRLVNDIKDSINDIVRRRPGVGWIRGDQALDPKVYKDLEEARRQNKELQEKLDKFGGEDIVFPSHLSHGVDLFEIHYTVSKRSKDNTIFERISGYYKISWDDLFAKLAELIYLENHEYAILRYIEKLVKETCDIDSKLTVTIEPRKVEQTRFQFEALGLIEAVAKSEEMMGSSETYIVWTFTDKGRRYISHLRALRRPAVS
jgi:rRNA processing protein Krr1/Pno1